MSRPLGWRITSAILCVWGVWSLACYEPREDRCVAGQARCDSSGSVTYAETCITSDSGPYYFQRDACYDWVGTCRIGEDWNRGGRRAFCAASEEPDPRCSPGAFFDQCTENGWIRCADGYVSVEALCPYNAECVLSVDGVGGCGAPSAPSPFCDDAAVAYVCDEGVTVRCSDDGFEISRMACVAGATCDPGTGRCVYE